MCVKDAKAPKKHRKGIDKFQWIMFFFYHLYSRVIGRLFCGIHSVMSYLQSLAAYFSQDIYVQVVLQRSLENVSAFKLADQDR